MPITLARIDDRRYDDLVAEALGRASVHTPEWTNLTRSDPGVTLIEVFAFLTETLLYRANQIPERNRKKFLQLLRIPLRTASAARGLIAIRNEAPSPNPLPIILPAGVEVRAGEVPFRTTRALDVLPVESRFYVKRRIVNPAPEVKQYYQQLYASYRGPAPEVQPDLYEAVPFPSRDGVSVALSSAIDNAVWLALLMRPSDTALTVDNVRKRIANRTLSLGVVPSLAESRADLPAGRAFGAEATVTLKVDAPKVPDRGGLPAEPSQRIAEYQAVAVKSAGDVFSVPGVIDVSLPGESALRLWNTASAPVTTQFLGMGINAVPISQRAAVIAELLPDGTGEPVQAARLSQAPVLPETVRITVTPETGGPSEWQEVDELSAAAPEVRVIDPRESPGRRLSKPAATDPSAAQRDPSHVFALNAESGEVRFGDGARGARPPERATIRASYEYARGAAGNVSAGRINAAPSLPEGFKVSNPVETWGGADAESVAEGEKQIARYLQHRDRLVTAEDFRTIADRKSTRLNSSH